MRRTYKVWIEIEELDAKGDPTGNDLGILPDSLGSFSGLKKAMAKVAEVVNEHGIDPENSDSVNAAPQAKRDARLPESARTVIEEVLHATKGHLEVLCGDGRNITVYEGLQDVVEGMEISIDKLRALLEDGKDKRPRRAPRMTACGFCGKPCDAANAHLHQGKLVGDECCWDDRLKASE